MKRWLTHILAGAKAAWRAISLSLGLYLFTLAFSLILVIPVRGFLLKHAGNSLALDNLVTYTNYTFINDFRLAYGGGWLPDMGQLTLLLILYLLIWTFFTGGIIERLRPDLKSSNFWAGCGLHFQTLLAVNVCFWSFHAILLLLFVAIYWTVCSGFSPDKLDTETIIFASFRWVWGVYLLFALILLLWQRLTQIARVKNENIAWYNAIRVGWKSWREQPLAYFGFGLLSLAILVIGYLLFHSGKQAIPVEQMRSGIILLFILTQFWLWIRVFLKLCFVGILWQLLRKY